MKTLIFLFKRKMIGLITVLLIAPFLVISQPTEEEILASIDLGTTWMVTQQNDNGSWGTSERVAYTGFALTKLCDRAYEHFYDSPFDPDYEYYQDVIDGFAFLFAQAKTHGPGTGIYFLEGTDPHHEIYNASIALMAISASYTPDKLISDIGSVFGVTTFEDLVGQMVIYFDWGQNDVGPDLGGWGYQPNLPLSDNSHSGYAVLGLRYAEAFGATIPAGVQTKLNIWIDVIQDVVDGDGDDGGSWYKYDWPWVNSLKTGNLLFEMSFYGDALAETRVQEALNYIESHWDDAGNGSIYNTGWDGHIQAMFCLMKGFESFDIETIEVGGVDRNWFEEFSTYLLDVQVLPAGNWNAGYWGDELVNTFWALYILEKVVPNAPPVAICQDIFVYADGDCFGYAVAIDFDNGSYDPEGEALTYSVSPPGPYPLGATTVTLTVTDIKDDSDDCDAIITVIDDTPPTADIDPLPDLVGECSVTVSAVPTATDNCAGLLYGTTTDPLTYTEQGVYTVTWTYNDGHGNTLQQWQTIIVDDVSAPTITTIESDLTMWPPNHKYQTFVIGDFVTAVSDNCADLAIADVYITKVTSDEQEDVGGNGDGKTFNDIVIETGCLSVDLRKERQGGNNGRVYTIYMRLDDGNDNYTEATAEVHVQHNPGNPAINDGEAYYEECTKSAIFAGNSEAETGFALNNYPNPFNGTTTIAFTLAEPNDVTLKVYNTLGVEVAILYNGFAEAEQKYTTYFKGDQLSEGIYLYVLQSKGKVLGMNKMLLIK